MREKLLLEGIYLVYYNSLCVYFYKTEKKIDTEVVSSQEMTDHDGDMGLVCESEASLGIYVLNPRPAKGCIEIKSLRESAYLRRTLNGENKISIGRSQKDMAETGHSKCKLPTPKSERIGWGRGRNFSPIKI